jgi:adenosylcobinamide-phosphate synthase
MLSAASVLFALLLDKLFGEPRRLHPLVGFGRLVEGLERKYYADSKSRGVLLLFALVLPFALLSGAVVLWIDHWLIGAIMLYLALGWQSLLIHAQRVQDALDEANPELARKQVACLVSRDTSMLDEPGIARATLESLLENGNDAIFAAIFWFLVAGVPGVLVYRLVNTLDAMWGYRSERYIRFGWAAARLDDVLNYIPARLTALSYALAGRFGRAIYCWKEQGPAWNSPNAGPVMAAGAGSLGVILGGTEIYHGQLQARITLGEGRSPDAGAVGEGIRLIQRALLLWVIAIMVGGWLIL